MATMVLVIGESGTGKSTSLRNCDPGTTAIVNPVGKALPFKGKFNTLDNETDARKIVKYVKEQVKEEKKLIAIDDFQYILAVPYMNRIKETGWDKYNDFGSNYFEIIEMCKDLPDDVVVVYYSHLETLDNGLTTVKLIGKLLREKITIEGLFTVVLRTGVSEAKYYFYTQNSGKDTVKSPIGMFPAYAIDNDMNYVADKIRNYYEVGGYKSDAEMNVADDEVAAKDVEKPTGKRKGRTKAEPKEEPKTAVDGSKSEENADSVDDTTTDKPKRTRKSRTSSDKTHDEVVAENAEKIAKYEKDCDDTLAEKFGDATEIPFDEAMDVRDSVEKPELETPPRRTRKERVTANSTGQDNTDFVKVKLNEDTYFYVPADDNYVIKRKGEEVITAEGGKQVMKVITKEEYGEGIKRIATETTPQTEVDAEVAEPVTRTRRTRRTR
ncbi:MAG: hypothetical protein R3Y47_02025 [Lachnospiraceae bacterium]